VITKKTLWLSIIISMLVGGIACVTVDRIYFQHTDTHFVKSKFMNYMTRELNLTELQQQQLDSIVTFMHPKFQSIRDKYSTDMKRQGDSTRTMIDRILTNEQRSKLQALNKQNQ